MKTCDIEKLYKDLGISISNLNADYNPDLYAKKIMNQFTKKNSKLTYSDKTILNHKQHTKNDSLLSRFLLLKNRYHTHYNAIGAFSYFRIYQTRQY